MRKVYKQTCGKTYMGSEFNPIKLEFNSIDHVTLLLYSGLSKIVKQCGRDFILKFSKYERPTMNIERFYNPEYQNLSDKDFIWELIGDMTELNEDVGGLKSVRKMRKYERDGVDLLDCLDELNKDIE